MKNIEIKHNMAIDFIYALSRYALRDLFESEKENFSFSYNEDIINWINIIDNNISPFMKSDVELLFENSMYNIIAITFIIIEKKLETPREFLDSFLKISSEEYIDIYFETFRFDVDDVRLNKNSNKEQIFAAAKDKLDEQGAKLLMQFIKYPDELKKRLDNLLVSFYEHFFKNYEDKTIKFMKKKVEEHNKYFKKNPKDFLETVVYGNYSNILESDSKLFIYVSYFYEYGLKLDIKKEYVLIVYGYALEQRMAEKYMKEASKNLFKALSDEKRLDILRLIGKRKWYGNELAKHFGLTTATMSYHINKLIDIGVVHFEAGEQNKIFYKINEDKLRELFDLALKDILRK